MQLKPDSRAMTVLLAFMTAIGPITMDIYLASMPHIGEAFGASAGAVQLTLSLYVVGFAMAQILYGPLSDFRGRRPLLLGGFALYLIATAACAMATSIEMLIVARLVQAIGAAGPIILARAVVRDLYVGIQAARQLGLMSAIMGVTPIGAPIVGGVLQAWFGWRATFIFMAIIGLVLALAAYLYLPETNSRPRAPAPTARGILGSFRVVARNKAFMSYATMLALSYAGVFAFLSGSSHVLQKQFGVSSIEFGLTFALCSLSYIAGNWMGSRLVSKRGLERMIRLGKNILLAAGALQLLGYWLLPQEMFALVVPQMLYFLGSGLMVPQFIAGALMPFPDRAGAASSLMGFVQMTSAAIVGAVLGVLLGTSAWPLVVAMSLAALALVVVFHLGSRARQAQLSQGSGI